MWGLTRKDTATASQNTDLELRSSVLLEYPVGACMRRACANIQKPNDISALLDLVYKRQCSGPGVIT